MRHIVKSYYTLVLPPVANPPAHYSAEHEVKLGSFSSEDEAHQFMKDRKIASFPYSIKLVNIPE